MVRGPVELRLRGFPSAVQMLPVVDSLRSLPTTWQVDRTTGVATPGPTAVTDVDDVVGEWTAIEVAGGAVPDDALPGLTVTSRDGRIELAYDDGVNGHYRSAELGPDGELLDSGGASSEVGCTGLVGRSCTRPSGFGVQRAARLALTDDGDLVLLSSGGQVLALYERAG